MEIKDRKPLPLRCIFCWELFKCKGNTGMACWECDYACDRFVLVDDDGNEIDIDD